MQLAFRIKIHSVRFWQNAISLDLLCVPCKGLQTPSFPASTKVKHRMLELSFNWTSFQLNLFRTGMQCPFSRNLKIIFKGYFKKLKPCRPKMRKKSWFLYFTFLYSKESQSSLSSLFLPVPTTGTS